MSFPMTRKRALGRQQGENSNIHATNHRINGWKDDLGFLPPASSVSSLYKKFDIELSLHCPSPPPKSNINSNKRRWSLRLSWLILVVLKTVLFFATTLVVSMTLPKLVFDAVRYLTMDRPALLYGSPTDWDDVSGCLSRTTQRRHVRDHFGIDGGDVSHLGANLTLPLNPDAVWNWSRYSSSSHWTPPSDGENASINNHTEERTKKIPRRRLLIAQYSGKGSYERLLREVEPINRAYARRWGHDYTTLVGTALKFPGLKYESKESESTRPNDGDNDSDNDGKNRFCRYYDNNDNANGTNSSSTRFPASSSSYNYEAQSTFNKIPLLFKAMDESPLKYDQVLILDSDTMIVDFEYDITSLLLSSDSSDQNQERGSFGMKKTNKLCDDQKLEKGDENCHTNEATMEKSDGLTSNHNNGRSVDNKGNTGSDDPYFLVAYRVWKFDSPSTWDVNAGITLWNLRHPNTRLVAEDWLKSSLSDPKQVLLKNDDQYFLQRSLQKVITNCTFCCDSKSGSSMGVFAMKCFRNWWNQHSLWPALLDYYNGGTYGESGSANLAGGAILEQYNGHASGRNGIRTVRDEFEYYNATLIKHFKRDTASWSRTGLDQRLLRIQEAKEVICRKWPKDCLL